MRIALVTLRFVPATGSTAAEHPAWEYELARALAAQGHRITLYARQGTHTRAASMIPASGIRIEYKPTGPLADLPESELAQYIPEFANHLEKSWARHRPDVVHAHDWPAGLAAQSSARRAGIPVLQSFSSLAVTERRLHMSGCGSGARVRLEVALARNAQAVLAASTAQASELTRLGVPRRALTVVPWGVDTDQFKPGGRVSRREGNARLVMTDRRGLDVALRALAAVPGADLVVADDPPASPRTGKGRRAFRAEADGVHRRLEFTGRLAWSELPALLRSADLLVSMADHEPSGTHAIHAAACGVPAAASDVGGNQDVVVDGITGVLIPPRRPDLLARRVRELLAAPCRLEAFGIAAADRARARYSWERIGRETVAAYARCMPTPISMPSADVMAATEPATESG
jgi:D-inositol-3-phosphate glycosyltransferase